MIEVKNLSLLDTRFNIVKYSRINVATMWNNLCSAGAA